MRIKALLFSLLFANATQVSAQNSLIDVVYLKNGSIIKGVVVEQIIGQSIKIETKDGSLFVFKTEEVAKITREAMGTTATAQSTVVTTDMPEIGKAFGGGVVFHVDAATRTVWIAASNDQAYRHMWGADGSTLARSYDDGQQNTNGILSFYQTTHTGPGHTSAAVCNYLTIGQFDDWYLPALNELERMYHQRSAIGGFGYGIYQSSTEQGRLDFYGIDFRPGKRLMNNFNKDNNDFNIRCIRRQSF